MKKGQIYEGIIERVDFPNKGMIYIPEEEKYVTVKNGIPGQKVRFMINKFKLGKWRRKTSGSAGKITAGDQGAGL